jgi:hypothetical protein
MDELKIIVKGLDRILFVVEQILENQKADGVVGGCCSYCGSDAWIAPPKKTHKEVLDE